MERSIFNEYLSSTAFLMLMKPASIWKHSVQNHPSHLIYWFCYEKNYLVGIWLKCKSMAWNRDQNVCKADNILPSKHSSELTSTESAVPWQRTMSYDATTAHLRLLDSGMGRGSSLTQIIKCIHYVGTCYDTEEGILFFYFFQLALRLAAIHS